MAQPQSSRTMLSLAGPCFSWQIRIIVSSTDTVLCSVFLSIDLFIKNFIYKEHKNKPAQILQDVSGYELMRSKFKRTLNCYFLSDSSIVRRWGGEEVMASQDKGTALPGTVSAPLPSSVPLFFTPDEDEFLQVLESGFQSCDVAWDMGRSLLAQLQ